jgi:tellurite resistance protein
VSKVFYSEIDAFNLDTDFAVRQAIQNLRTSFNRSDKVVCDNQNQHDDRISKLEKELKEKEATIYKTMLDSLCQASALHGKYLRESENKIEQRLEKLEGNHRALTKHTVSAANELDERLKKLEAKQEQKTETKECEHVWNQAGWSCIKCYDAKPLQKLEPKFKVGQVWESRQKGIAIVRNILDGVRYPVRCDYFLMREVTKVFGKNTFEIIPDFNCGYTLDGIYSIGSERGEDLIKLLS